MTERDDSARRAGESAGLSVSGVETDTQTDAAEVEWWITTHFLDKGGEKVMGPFVSRDLAIEVRVLREAFEGRCDYFVDSCPAARAAAAVTTSSAKSSDLATRVPQDESQRAAGGGGAIDHDALAVESANAEQRFIAHEEDDR